MKRNPYYMLYHIAGIPYILPFGQNIADHKRGVRINETGAFIWELLAKESTEEELLQLCAGSFEMSSTELPKLQDDLRQFLLLLSSHGMLDCSDKEATSEESCHYLKIGGLLFQIFAPEEALSPCFDAFYVSPESICSSCPKEYTNGVLEKVNQKIVIRPMPPRQHANGTVLLRNEELTVMEDENQYIFLFPGQPQMIEATLSKDASLAIFYCLPPFTDALRESLFHAIRLSFLYLAQMHHMAVLHSASLLYKDKVWLFSGSSGTGKSTHTGLWHTLLHTPLINGDLNLLALEDGVPVIHGLPWCGTSGIWDTKSYQLGGIILLKQSSTDRVEELPADKQQLLVTQRLISPTWTGELQGKNLEFVEKFLEKIPVCRLHCTKEQTAVETIREWIDNLISV